MKTKELKLAAIFLTSILTTTCIPIDAPEHDEKIHLEQQQNGENPTGKESWDMRTSRTSTSVSVFITNFSGIIIIEAAGKNGNVVSAKKTIDGNGVLELNTSSFPGGEYSLSIQASETNTNTIKK